MPTPTQFNAKFNVEWQENIQDKLISAIPIEWRTSIQTSTSTKFVQYQPLLYTAKSIKRATNLFCTTLIKQCSNDTDTKWETLCSQICYIFPMKLRSFYFKLIHRALPCNYTLYKMKITQTDYCRFCYNVPQTLMHMFWECPYVRKLWKAIWALVSIIIHLYNT